VMLLRISSTIRSFGESSYGIYMYTLHSNFCIVVSILKLERLVEFRYSRQDSDVDSNCLGPEFVEPSDLWFIRLQSCVCVSSSFVGATVSVWRLAANG
jgi:hypothetical protein